MTSWRIIEGDCVETMRAMPAGSVQTCVTSPPYFGLRDYGHDGQIGLEPTPDEFVTALVGVFREVRRVLRDDGTVWLNLGDSYNADGRKGRAHMGEDKNNGYSAWVNKTMDGTKPKDLLGIPWLVAFALRNDGWYLRSDIIWAKPNPMPESVTDRPTKAHEYLFLLSKSPRYWYDANSIREEPHQPSRGKVGQARHTRMADHPKSRAEVCRYCAGSGEAYDPHTGEGPICPECGGTGEAEKPSNRPEYRASLSNPTSRNKRSVWTVATQPYPGAHFATFPPKLIEPCILAGSPERACSVCGAPWTRIVEREPSERIAPQTAQMAREEHFRETRPVGQRGNAGMPNGQAMTNASRTVGWEPTCDHGAPAAPGTVLDPFAGAGTTGMVALRHGRSFIGIELSPEYARLARERIIADAPLMNQAGELAA